MTKNLEGEKNPAEAAEQFRRLVESWMAEGPAYDREAWPELKEGLDPNRPEYRKQFPDQTEGQLKAAQGSSTFQMQRIPRASLLHNAGRQAGDRGGAGMEDTRSWLAYPTVYT